MRRVRQQWRSSTPGPECRSTRKGWYQFTSAPLITRGLVVLAGSIYDNMSDTMPSGVVRAWDAKTGKLVWNFDPGNPASTAPIAAGQHYSASSPNSWSTSSADEKLGLIYVPIGNGRGRPVGRQARRRRRRSSRRRSSRSTPPRASVRWVFQTVHHDLWDMDVPAQPALVDLPIPGKGWCRRWCSRPRPATSSSSTAAPAARGAGAKRPVPQGAAPGDYTVADAALLARLVHAAERVRAKDMWGATMLDQLGCRIAFQRMRYEGRSRRRRCSGRWSIRAISGSWTGAAWRSIRCARSRSRTPITWPSSTAYAREIQYGERRRRAGAAYNPNKGAPFAAYLNPFLSKLGLPCQAPPWGYVAGMDLTTGKVLWKHKNGTIVDTSPVPLPFKLGVPDARRADHDRRWSRVHEFGARLLPARL